MNYQKLLDKKLEELTRGGKRPRLLLHACCAPCSSYVVEYLSEYFELTLFYYNPNIYPEAEYNKRGLQFEKLLLKTGRGAGLIICGYTPDAFAEAVRSLEHEPEGGARCAVCFRLRLEASAFYAKEHGFDLFTTTLSVSPHKNSALLNEIGGELAQKHGVGFLFSDFKKKEGYKRSLTLSAEYDLYRQDYCGCEYSIRHNAT